MFNRGDAEFDGSSGGSGYPAATVAILAQSPALGTLAAGTPFAGDRYHHGIYLLVGNDGRFTLSYRTYDNCGPQPPGALCDYTVNNLIIDGGNAGGRLTSITRDTATAVITYDPGGLFGGPSATMTYDPTNDEITFAGTNFCGTASPSDCGA